MLPELLENLEKILEGFQYKFTDKQNNEIYNVLQYYNGGILPLGALRRRLNVDMDVVSDLVIYLESKGIVKSMYKVICRSSTNDIREEIYDDIRKIPKKICDKCPEECLYYDNIVVAFKVVL